MMKLLAIDTSTEQASIALSVNDAMYYEERSAQRTHAQWILPVIEQLLAKADIRIKDLDGIVFGRGPGSFTGLRIACSIAKGLAYAHDLPLFPVSSLAAIAYELQAITGHSLDSHTILAMLDARMNEVYWAVYTDSDYEATEQVSSVKDVVTQQATPIILAGVGYPPGLPDTLRQRIIMDLSVYPTAKAMIRLVQSGIIEPVTAAQASPVYVRNQVVQGESRG
ncbi:tRNA (adenosine(37)-N6)-threonylcarbamoyltransferase complex dimerization subunit type 1 TsaB [Legionella spiritensis]|uniref:tRNA (adenosine(37)-N6)-threonylcarbamoyltransferase complex dimerization subunit type 1 TsaB n=1 Tax=Legionella spiritensis TaxID=452 RepID=UPI000F6D48F9|nr:tRNA (adenosine(37)-N6)-threonylcarbamoyltransferase complex dimerization subunit type 1 TsaB [Legionella spiritensis]VEG90699.1 glycoprotease (O-sialoglycoprotein endopeptidase) [Legionella spiritensis]